MSIEEVIREIVSKVCPFHGKHATVKVRDTGHIIIAACCDEFHSQMENIVTRGVKNPLTDGEHQVKNTLVPT